MMSTEVPTTTSGLAQKNSSYGILTYRVVEWSSYSAGYRPELVQEDHPADQASRWSSAANDQHQYIILRLEAPALLGTDGTDHVCNLREFKVLVRSEDTGKWTEVLHAGLRNDSEPETFPLVYPDWEGTGNLAQPSFMPVHYVKIIPLAAWGNSFNYSIWYVELRGVSRVSEVATVTQRFQARLRHESWRLCLKFLREQSGMDEIFQVLQSRTGVALEDPLVSELFRLTVQEGAFVQAESALLAAHTRNPDIFREYIEVHVPYEPRWARLDRGGVDADGATTNHARGPQPPVRGGHQMCWDPVGRAVFLLGGWDGHRDLGDFWRYDVSAETWTCLSEDTRREGGPGPRSCHKMVIHVAQRRLYVLGRYVDTETRALTSLQADFYYYDLNRHTWTCASSDMVAEGGPGLIYDHQMAVDEAYNVIYVFGGRIISAGALAPVAVAETLYSGLYAFDIGAGKWRLIRGDNERLVGTPTIKSRIGHSMVFNPASRQLYIYSGQRHKDYLSDFYVYDVDRDMVVEMIKETGRVGGPDAGFTQRSTLDVKRQELFLFSGLMREKSNNSGGGSALVGGGNGQTHQGIPNETTRNSFWLYNLTKRRWTRLYSNEKIGTDSQSPCDLSEPSPRFAHQLVYDAETGTHYLFGGNPGEAGAPRRRLGDFWQLHLVRAQSPADILRRSLFLIRRQQFYEMCLARVLPDPSSQSVNNPATSPSMVSAMRFLQIEVAHVVNHNSMTESREFRALSSWLLQAPLAPVATTVGNDGGLPVSNAARIHETRLRLFRDLVTLLPSSMQPPRAGIAELVHF